MEISKLDDNKLKKAIELQKLDRDNESLSILKELNKKNPKSYKISGILGLVLGKIGKRKEAIPYLNFATLNSKYEHFHLSLYISYAEIEEYDRAFKVLFNYLEKYSADLFQDTLKELLEGLLEGYGITYRDKIIFYAKKNHILIPKGLD